MAIPTDPARRNLRPAFGFGHYLRDVVFGALDGVVTTMAVVAGTAGAGLGARVGIIMGLANLVADGLSMGASNYLGLKSELEQRGETVADEAPWRHAGATLAAFVLAGSLPLWGYWVGPRAGITPLPAAAALAAAGLMLAGAVRAPFVRKPVLRSAVEMLLIGAAAALSAYLIGLAADRWLLR